MSETSPPYHLNHFLFSIKFFEISDSECEIYLLNVISDSPST